MAPTINSFVNSFTNRLEAPVRQHLKNVYGCLSMSAVSAATGAYVHLYTEIQKAGFMTALGGLGLLMALLFTPDNGKNQKLRLGYLLGFAFLSGLGLGPLLEIVISIDPSIIVTGLIGTCVVFVSFSISALLAARGQWLYIGGTLISLSNMTVLLLLANLFLRSSFVYHLELYLGLVLMCGFIIYDTQLIVEKFRMGNKDFIAHSVLLFVDFFRMFSYIIEILTVKEQQRQKNRKRSD
ncbi:bax inhibitor 1 [Venturia canescens]|uniref:bax inhibitor 1 n=1 Tax=Venturia canescens TaxID=32260 RepID=UPI001C9D369F|nr:bax inhibitor 1 [Venturia canescens]